MRIFASQFGGSPVRAVEETRVTRVRRSPPTSTTDAARKAARARDAAERTRAPLDPAEARRRAAALDRELDAFLLGAETGRLIFDDLPDPATVLARKKMNARKRVSQRAQVRGKVNGPRRRSAAAYQQGANSSTSPLPAKRTVKLTSRTITASAVSAARRQRHEERHSTNLRLDGSTGRFRVITPDGVASRPLPVWRRTSDGTRYDASILTASAAERLSKIGCGDCGKKRR